MADWCNFVTTVTPDAHPVSGDGSLDTIAASPAGPPARQPGANVSVFLVIGLIGLGVLLLSLVAGDLLVNVPD